MKRVFAVLWVIGLLFIWGCRAHPTTNTVIPLPSSTSTTVPSTDYTTSSTASSAAASTTHLPTSPTTTHTVSQAIVSTTTTAATTTTAYTTTTTTKQTTTTTKTTSHQGTEPSAGVLLYDDMKAMWLSQFDLTNIYLNGNAQRSKADFTSRMEQVLDNVKAQGFNTVILQVRPYADSMYPSAYYPMSSYVTGKIGRAAQYDPVEIVVRLAHERSLSVHAWINPLRGMAENEILSVSTDYAIRRWYDDPQLRGKYVVLVSGRWYLNPAYDEVTELIRAGAEEALHAYDFDGLHMDDYFYPTTDVSFDAAAYADYQANGGSSALADFRRDAISELVRRLYDTTHSSRRGRIFGISPAGNTNTVFNTQYADIYRWCGTSGYIDYICPQVYYGLEHGTHDFVKVCNTYQNMIKTDAVDLIIGMSFGKAFSKDDPWAGSGRDEWKNHRDVMVRCLQATSALTRCRGISVFCYQYFFDTLSGVSVAETAEERANFVPVLKQISWK